MRIFAASNAGGRDHEDDSFRPPASKAGLVLLGGALFVSDDGAGAISRIRYRRLRALIRGQAGIGQVQTNRRPVLSRRAGDSGCDPFSGALRMSHSQ